MWRSWVRRPLCTVLIIVLVFSGEDHLRVQHGHRVAFVFHLCASRRSLQLTFDVLVFVGLGGFCCFLAGETP